MSRSTWLCKCALVMVILLVALAGGAAQDTAEPGGRVYLHKNWQIQSSCVAKATGEQISTAGFDGSAWHKSDLPATVVGALVTDKTYADPYFGTNLKTLPGMNYSNKSFFAIQDMPAGSPFLCSWWFRAEFDWLAGLAQKNSWLHFLGINYRANVWVNGVKIGDAKEVAGTYRAFEFNVNKNIHAGKTNAVALEIFAPQKDDLGITWVDWNPTPADRDMGIWKEVFLTTSGDVSVRHPFVAAKLDAEYKTAALTVSADLRNTSEHAVKGVLRAEVDGKSLQQPVELAAGESKNVRFTPEEFAQLKLEHPRIWWPYQMGEPNLYTAKLSFDTDGQTSDSASVTFGVREVTSEITDKGYRLFKINGRKLLIRGAAWAPDMFLRWSSERLDADLAYVKDMGLNTIRLEGRLDHDELFDKTDKLGILVMPGWTCCDAWERWKLWKGDQRKIAAAIVDGSNWTAAESSERFCVAEWQRRAPSCRCRENVLGHRERFGVAKSDNFFGFGRKDNRYGEIGREDDRAVRVCAAGVLAGGQESGRGLRVQHGDESGSGDSSARIA